MESVPEAVKENPHEHVLPEEVSDGEPEPGSDATAD